MLLLLDTNVLSELRRPSPDRKVLAFIEKQPLSQLCVSAVTLAEIRFGIELVSDSLQRGELRTWLDEKIRPMFTGRVFEITESVILRWRLLVERGRKTGRTFPQPDLFLAATVLEHGLTLVTRNIRDFDGIGLTIINPWEPAP